jgi:hypothetical protein
MQDETRVKRNFLNRRDWTSFVGGLPGTTNYPKLAEAVKSGRAWFSEGATHASSWLAVGAELLSGDGSRVRG